jgi:hypothetical protein
MIKSRMMRWAGHVVRMGEMRNAYNILVVKPEGKRSLGISGRRWEDTIKTDLQEMGKVSSVLMWLKLGTDGGLS